MLRITGTNFNGYTFHKNNFHDPYLRLNSINLALLFKHSGINRRCLNGENCVQMEPKIAFSELYRPIGTEL